MMGIIPGIGGDVIAPANFSGLNKLPSATPIYSIGGLRKDRHFRVRFETA